MEKKVKTSRLDGVPAWALSLSTLSALILLIFILKLFQLFEYNAIKISFSIFYVMFLPIACFIICKTHPNSVWYTPFICNGMFLFALIVILMNLPSDQETSMILLIMGSVFVISVILAIVGARIGRRLINQTNN